MANTTSHSYTFDKSLPIDEIVEESYERIGLQNVSGYQLKTAKRSLNLLFSEWSNRGLHYWEVANQGFTLVDGNRLNFYYTRRVQDAGAYSNAINVPYRFVPCMAAGLAYYLSQKNMPQRSQELKLFYEDELARAVKEDADITSTYIAPKVYYPDTAT